MLTATFGYNRHGKQVRTVTVGIIGAGAAGMTAALAASLNENVQVVLMERHARVGRKLQATGNGRCNLTNIHAATKGYHGEDISFIQPAMRAMDPEKTLAWFRSLGLYTVIEDSGKVYPYSDQANSVVDVLRLALNRPNIDLRTGFEVQKIAKSEDGFTVTNGEETIFCDKLIIACGGLAGTKLGGSMAGYKLLTKLGQHVVGVWDDTLLIARQHAGGWYELGKYDLTDYSFTPLNIGHEKIDHRVEHIHCNDAGTRLQVTWTDSDGTHVQIFDLETQQELYTWTAPAEEDWNFFPVGDNGLAVWTGESDDLTVWKVEY